MRDTISQKEISVFALSPDSSVKGMLMLLYNSAWIKNKKNMFFMLEKVLCQLGVKRKTAEGHSFAELNICFIFTPKRQMQTGSIPLGLCCVTGYLFKPENQIFHPEHLGSSYTLSIRSLWSFPGISRIFPEFLDLMLSSFQQHILQDFSQHIWEGFSVVSSLLSGDSKGDGHVSLSGRQPHVCLKQELRHILFKLI